MNNDIAIGLGVICLYLFAGWLLFCPINELIHRIEKLERLNQDKNGGKP